MTVTLEEILKRVEKLGLPFAQNEFRKTKETPIPPLPYLIYILPQASGRGADKRNLVSVQQVGLELYTDKAEKTCLEKRIEKEVLFDIAYEKFRDIIQKEEMVQVAYEFIIVEKIRKR